MKSTYTALRIAYIGRNYYGWARQPDKEITTIEEKVLYALKKSNLALDEYKYASRTDKGVNAIEQTIKIKNDFETTYLGKINKHLPDDIRVWAKARVPKTFSPRYPIRKVYHYSFFSPKKLDIENIKRSCNLLEGLNDFTNFSQNDSARDTSDTTRILQKLCLKTLEPNFFLFKLEGKSFLWKMCRKIIDHLIQVGLGQSDVNDTYELLNKKVKTHRLPKAIQSYGLTLAKMDYPHINFKIDRKIRETFVSHLDNMFHASYSFSKAVQLISQEISNRT